MEDVLDLYAQPPDAKRPLVCFDERLCQEIHHTPKHGSWLNMVESELSVLVRQCLQRRIPNIETLEHEVSIWECDRNLNQVCVDWRFRTEDARVKLSKIYPTPQN